MKVKKLYAEFDVKFPKTNKECYVILSYHNKSFIIYYGKELTDDEYDSIISRFKVGDDFSRELRLTGRLAD